MSKNGSDGVLASLYDQWEDLKRRYKGHREGVERGVASALPLNETVLDFFAAGQAALEQALLDDLINWREHATLSRIFTAFHAYAIDHHSGCRVRFEAKPFHPFGASGAEYEIDVYLEIGNEVHDELATSTAEVRRYYEVAEVTPEGHYPYKATTAAMLHIATTRFDLDEGTAHALACYFAVFGEVVEQVEFGIRDAAIELGNAVGMDVSDLEEKRRLQ